MQLTRDRGSRAQDWAAKFEYAPRLMRQDRGWSGSCGAVERSGAAELLGKEGALGFRGLLARSHRRFA